MSKHLKPRSVSVGRSKSTLVFKKKKKKKDRFNCKLELNIFGVILFLIRK